MLSKGERAIASYLMEKRIPFVTDKTFPDCRDRAELRFDFYLPNQVTLIAYDGLQHFEAIEAFGGQSGLETLQKHDQMKMRYAVDNRIKLICIDGNSLGSELMHYLMHILRESMRCFASAIPRCIRISMYKLIHHSM